MVDAEQAKANELHTKPYNLLVALKVILKAVFPHSNEWCQLSLPDPFIWLPCTLG